MCETLELFSDLLSLMTWSMIDRCHMLLALLSFKAFSMEFKGHVTLWQMKWNEMYRLLNGWIRERWWKFIQKNLIQNRIKVSHWADFPLLNFLQISSFKVGLADKLSVLVWFRHRRGALSLQRLAAAVHTAEAGDGAVVPPWSRHPPVGRLYFQPAGSVTAPLPSHLHQALHCVPGPAGSLRQSRTPALGSSSGSDTGLVYEGGELGGWDGPHEGGGIALVERGCECALSAAAWCSPSGLAAPAGAAGAWGHAGVTLASAD